jgi:hypothetical protein
MVGFPQNVTRSTCSAFTVVVVNIVVVVWDGVLLFASIRVVVVVEVIVIAKCSKVPRGKKN